MDESSIEYQPSTALVNIKSQPDTTKNNQGIDEEDDPLYQEDTMEDPRTVNIESPKSEYKPFSPTEGTDGARDVAAFGETSNQEAPSNQ